MFSTAVAQKARKWGPQALSQRPNRSIDQVRNRAIWNLLLAARARVGHIRRNGAVAEWLKAAVC